MASLTSGMVNDLVDKDQMRAMVGAGFSEARWNQIAKGRDKIMKTELMDAVQGIVTKAGEQAQLEKAAGTSTTPPTNGGKRAPTAASVRTEAILALLTFCDRGGKQLIAAYPMMRPRKGGVGPDHREMLIKAIASTGDKQFGPILMELEARLCMGSNRGVDVELNTRLIDHLITTLEKMQGARLSKVCGAILKFAATDKGDSVRSLKRTAEGDIVGDSEETKALVSFVDSCLAILPAEERAMQGAEALACRLVGHAFQLLTGLLVDKSKARFATKSGGRAFEAGTVEEDPDLDLSDVKTLVDGNDSIKIQTELRAPVRHELMINEMKERGNRCMKKNDFNGAITAYTTALGKGTWVEQAIELVEAEKDLKNDATLEREEFERQVAAIGLDQTLAKREEALGMKPGEMTEEEKAHFEKAVADNNAVAEIGEGECGNEEEEESEEESSDEEEEEEDNDAPKLTSRDKAERALLLQHALLANRSMAFSKLGKHKLAFKDAEQCLQCRPDWPKAHWRKASALKLSGKVVEAADVLEQALDTLSSRVDIDEDGEKWKKEFAREVKKLKADIKKDVTGKSNTELIAMGDLGGDEDGEVGEKGVVVAGEGEGEAKVEGEKEEDEEVRYSDIISPEFGTFVVVCFLIGGYFKSAWFITFMFCVSLSAIMGSPGKRRKPPPASMDDADYDSDEEDAAGQLRDPKEYETEAGILLTQWMKSKTTPAAVANPNSGQASKIEKLRRRPKVKKENGAEDKASTASSNGTAPRVMTSIAGSKLE